VHAAKGVGSEGDNGDSTSGSSKGSLTVGGDIALPMISGELKSKSLKTQTP
jgi:hypothetical protein